MDTTETYIKMCDCEEIQKKWVEETTLADLPSFCWDKSISRVCVLIWQPESLKAKIGIQDTNSLLVSIEWDKELNHWTPEAMWRHDTIWLPRQGQLQEMVGEPVEGLLLRFRRFTNPDNFCTHGDHEAGFYQQGYCGICWPKREEIFKQFTSMEQLWLAFVMKEKFNKVWDGKEWKDV